MNDYHINIERLHHSECTLEYKDSEGELSVWVDQSPSEEYDYVTSEREFKVSGDRLSEVINNIQSWARKEGLVIKVWKGNEE